MTTHWIDPLVPAGENTEATLNRLSQDITSLSGLMSQAEHQGGLHLANIFCAARATKVEEAQTLLTSASNEQEAANKSLGE